MKSNEDVFECGEEFSMKNNINFHEINYIRSIVMEVPHLRISISENEIIEGAKNILPLFRPDWDINSIRFKIFTDGITNKLLGCYNGSEDHDVILIRVYGNKTDLLIDRQAETRNFKFLNAAGLAPRLYGTFEGGIVYEYVEGDILSVDSCRIEPVYPLIAQTMADVHCVQTEDGTNRKPALWIKLRQFLNLAPRKFTDTVKQARFEELFKVLPQFEEEFVFLEEKLSNLGSPTVFCHNDLLLANIIYNRKKNYVTFIDYEYAAYNYQAYDIANHFNEFAGVENVDYSLFPDKNFQCRWLRIYLERYRSKINGGEEEIIPVSENDVEALFDIVQKFTLASHFLWGVWALIQAEYSSINFDFINYALIRFKEYHSRKKKIFYC